MSYLKQIDVENFKSWRGKQIIGPFLRFSCIIGTNGSGKSNVMDAISFATGERSSSLRVKHLRDLIHGAHVGQPVSRSATVCLTYCNDEEEETQFSRSITGDSSEYRVNEVQVNLSQYLRQLEEIGIIAKAQNCLVFQGTVESIALKDPKERTKMFESISQSRELSSEYEQKKAAMLRAKEDTQFHFNKKKSAVVERKQVSQEKLEAERYQSLLDELNEQRLQLTLTRLFHSERSINSLNEAVRLKQQVVSLGECEQKMKAQRREHGRLQRDTQLLNKSIRAQEQVLSQCQSQYIKAKVNSSHHKKKVEETQVALRRAEEQLELKKQELRQGRQEVEELEEAWRSYDREAKRQQILSVSVQLERYQELKDLSRRQSAVLNQQADKLHWDIEADHERLSLDQRRHKEVQAGIRNYQTQLEDVMCRAQKLEEYTATCRCVSLEQEQSLSLQLQTSRARAEQVQTELGAVLQELGNARLETHENKRQSQRKEVLERLQRLCPDTVYGRLSDLVSPIHKKYQLAVTKVFSCFLNAIVVSSERVARDCIQFIKEERCEPETFLPIDYLDVHPLNERLRELSGAKMAVDVVQVSSTAIAPQLRRVVQFVCENTLVCETIKEARVLAFDRRERHKTVALDGTMFSKSGVISGGSSHLRSKARCWDEAEVKELKERKEKLAKELSELMKLSRKEADLKQIQAECHGAQTRLKYSSTDLDLLRRRALPKIQADISRLESDLANLESEIQMQEEHLEEKDLFICCTQMEDEVFAEFCEEIGVKTIREYEQEHLKNHTEHDKKRLEFESQVVRLNAQLEYEQTQLQQQKKKLQHLLETVEREEEVVEDQSQVQYHTYYHIKNNPGLWSLRELVKLQMEVMTLESELEQKRLFRHNLLLSCKIQGLPIRLISGDLSHVSQLEEESESTLSTVEIYEREAQIIIDYSGLRDSNVSPLQCLQEEQEVEACVEHLTDSLLSLEEVLGRTVAPNLKALEKMRQVKEKLHDITEVTRRCSLEFEAVKSQRCQLFTHCFEHVSVKVDEVYKRICRNKSAQAILSADNPEEPYLGGISYNCVAPGKRFMSMDNLSGGEKALAALALVFAIHSYRPAPFLILDEVDAALDNSNIGKVTSFIRDESRQNLQIIVISLKEEFFSKADALLGVYSDLDEWMFSRILTLDLRPYFLASDDNGQHSQNGQQYQKGHHHEASDHHRSPTTP
uniref:Structural maintenance of chromosomes protein n=1 Tax=Periophthalmus magnuspinnatus TaxID=409849 RepID=A0A3B3ZYL3_9GOBI